MKELVDQLDLDAPGLEGVKVMVGRQQWAVAGEILIGYYMGKRQERCLAFWDQTASEDEQPLRRGSVSTHWARGLTWLRNLGLQYVSGDDAARQRASQQLVRELPAWLDQCDEGDQVAAAGMCLGDAMTQSGLIRTWYTFLPSPYISSSFKLRFLRCIAEQAAGLLGEATSKRGMWGWHEAVELGYAGALFPELKGAPAWRECCFEFANQFFETGDRSDAPREAMPLSPPDAEEAAAVMVSFFAQIAKLGYRDVLEPGVMAGLQRLNVARGRDRHEGP
jgi:hypothetical protein